MTPLPLVIALCTTGEDTMVLSTRIASWAVTGGEVGFVAVIFASWVVSVANAAAPALSRSKLTCHPCCPPLVACDAEMKIAVAFDRLAPVMTTGPHWYLASVPSSKIPLLLTSLYVQMSPFWGSSVLSLMSAYLVLSAAVCPGPTTCRTGRSSSRAVLPMISISFAWLTACALAAAASLVVKHPRRLPWEVNAHHCDPTCRTVPGDPTPGSCTWITLLPRREMSASAPPTHAAS